MDYKIKEETLSGIANAIRSKSGSSEAIKVSEFAEQIETIPTGSDIELLENMQIPVDFSEGDQYIDAPEGTAVKSAVIQKPENLVPKNIAKGINIAGIVGTQPTYEILQNVPIDLDFSEGNQYIEPPEGQAVKSAIIQKPENLIPENIAEGIDIAGIIGTLTAGGGGGGNIKVACGTFTGERGTSKVITHGLGVIPDFAAVFTSRSSGGTVAKNDYYILINYSSAFRKAQNIGTWGWGCYFNNSTYYQLTQLQDTIEKDGAGYFLNGATTETVTVDPRLVTGRDYFWIVIGGLT